ncbi:MAG: glycosyltransferase [Armatimonadetes bacterium]|nr:glycosyltransferase [Armatimonadota bacterium]
MECIFDPGRSFYLGLLENGGDLVPEERARRRVLRPRPGRLERWLGKGGGPLRGFLRYVRYSLLLQWLIWRLRPRVVVTVCLEAMIAGCFTCKLGAVWLGSVGSDNHEVLRREHTRFQPILQKLLGLVYRRPDFMIAASGGLKDVLSREFGVPTERIEVIHNPVDVERVRARSAEPLQEEGFLLGVGRLIEVKGFELLLRALARVPGTDLVLLGEGAQRNYLETVAAELSISRRVRMPGYEENPWKYMKRAALVVVPSLSEGFSNVLAEALAAGACVVASDCPHGPKEIVRNGIEARMVPAGDVPALAEAIGELLNDAPARERLRRAAAERAWEFDVSAIGPRYLQFLDRVGQG